MDKVQFRAVNFGRGGSSNGFRSFTERLDRKERYKELDARADARDAENLRRYDIAQGRLNNQQALAETALARTTERQNKVWEQQNKVFQQKQDAYAHDVLRQGVVENQEDADRDIKHYRQGLQLADEQTAREQAVLNQTRADEEFARKALRREITESYDATNQGNSENLFNFNMKAAQDKKAMQDVMDAQTKANLAGVQALPDLVMNTNTEMANALNNQYKHINDSNVSQKEKDKQTAELNSVTESLFEDNEIDLNRVTNPKAYGAELSRKLRAQGVDPLETKKMVDAYTANALDESKAAESTTKQLLVGEKDAYDKKISANNKKSRQGDLSDAKSINDSVKEGLGNTWFDSYKGLEKNSKTGRLQIKGDENDDDNQRVGIEELGRFTTDLLLSDIVVKEKSQNKGKSIPMQTRRPIKEEIMAAYQQARSENLTTSNHIDGKEALQYLEAIMKKNGMNPENMKQGDKQLADTHQQRVNKIVKDNKIQTGEERLEAKQGLERRHREELAKRKLKK